MDNSDSRRLADLNRRAELLFDVKLAPGSSQKMKKASSKTDLSLYATPTTAAEMRLAELNRRAGQMIEKVDTEERRAISLMFVYGTHLGYMKHRAKAVAPFKFPSMCTLGIIFILIVPATLWTFVFSLIFATGLAALAPNDAIAYQGAITGVALLIGTGSAPFLSGIGDRLRDFRLPLLYCGLQQFVGTIGLIYAAQVQSLEIYFGSAVLVAAAIFQVSPVGNAVAGTYGAAALDKAGTIAATMLFAVTVMPLIGTVLLAVFPYTLEDPTVIYVLAVFPLLSMISILCLIPKRFLQPHQLLDLDDEAPGGCCSILANTCGTICAWFTKREYRPFLLVNLGLAFAYTPVQSTLAMLPYLLEDFGLLPDQATVQERVTLWMMGGQLMLGAITIPLGKLFDIAPPLGTLLVALAVGILAIPPYYYANLNVIGVSVVLGTLIAGQVIMSGIVPFALTKILHDPRTVGQDIAGLYFFSGLVVAAMTGIQGSVMDSLGTTGKTMDFGREQYPESTYYAVLVAYVGIYVFAGIFWILSQNMAARHRAQAGGRTLH